LTAASWPAVSDHRDADHLTQDIATRAALGDTERASFIPVQIGAITLQHS